MVVVGDKELSLAWAGMLTKTVQTRNADTDAMEFWRFYGERLPPHTTVCHM